MENPLDINHGPKKSVLRSLALMFRWMGKYWILLIVAFGLLYFISYIRTITPLFGQHIIDAILGNGESKLPLFFQQFIQADTVGRQLLLTALLIAATDFVRAVSIFLRRSIPPYSQNASAINCGTISMFNFRISAILSTHMWKLAM